MNIYILRALIWCLLMWPCASWAQNVYIYTINGKQVAHTQPLPDQTPTKIIRPVKRTPKVPRIKKIPYIELVHKWAGFYGLPTSFVLAVIEIESGFNPKAVSRVGAMGLMQLMPKVAKAYGVKDAFDPDQNIQGGCALLARLKVRHKGDVNNILAAYNAGGANVRKKGGTPSHATKKYIEKIVFAWSRYKRQLKEPTK